MKRWLSCILALALAASLTVPAFAAGFRDVPAGSALAGEVAKAVSYGLMQGYSGTEFGYKDSMTRAQFVTVLSRMMNWQSSTAGGSIQSVTSAMALPAGISDTYYAAIGAAAKADVVDTNTAFRPNDAITRGEMAEMLVRALGLKSAAALCDKENTLPFTDVKERVGYITVAYEIGMTKGTTDTTFTPNATATRAQAAAMLVRIYEKLHGKTDFIHGFYAISSYSQIGLTDSMDAVSAGWSRMTWDGKTALLSTTTAGGNEYYIPSGYSEVTGYWEGHGTKLNLCVFMDAAGGVRELLASADGRNQAVEQIIQEVTVSYKAIGKNPYSGVTIDFEGLRSASEADFVVFLRELSGALRLLDKSLYVCVSPAICGSAYYDGYDYRSIAALADKVIVMAHDYDTRDMSGFVGTDYYRTAAPAPLDQIYWSLRTVVNAVEDDSKVVLGFSSRTVAWKVDSSGKLLSATPSYPSVETVAKRLSQSNTAFGWSDTYQQSWAIYTTEDGSRYFLWYQDDASVQRELETARLLGVSGVSLWRLGILPTQGSYSWQTLLQH